MGKLAEVLCGLNRQTAEQESAVRCELFREYIVLRLERFDGLDSGVKRWCCIAMR
jgi:hypothetical protein